MFINSSEYYNALNDYNIEVIEGYHFKGTDLFNKYINDMYNLRLKFDKSNPCSCFYCSIPNMKLTLHMNLIAKLLMNSLYGRFGLNPLLPDTQIINKNSLEKIVDSSEITEIIEFEDRLLIQYIEEKKVDNYNNEELDVINTSNIAIASAITAYSRITMAKIKKYCLDNYTKIYYSDTDSVFTDQPLPDFIVGSKLGEWKLEGIYSKAVFLAPKVYGLIDQNGKEIVKCKGYKNKNLNFNDLRNLLTLNESIKLPQEKWY